VPSIGGDLGEDGLVPLALRAGTSGDIDCAGGINAHGRALEWSGARAFNIAADAEAEKAPLAPSLCLLEPEGGEATERIDRLAQRSGIVAAVINDGHAVAIDEANRIGNLLRRDHVPKPHFHRIEIKRARNEIDQTLDHERRFGSTGATIGRIGSFGVATIVIEDS
jgi:hypothetical protein